MNQLVQNVILLLASLAPRRHKSLQGAKFSWRF